MLAKEKPWMASNDPRDWAKYKKLRNTINNNIKTSKASYYSNAFSQSKGNNNNNNNLTFILRKIHVNMIIMRIILEQHGKPPYFPSHQQYNGQRNEVEWFYYF